MSGTKVGLAGLLAGAALAASASAQVGVREAALARVKRARAIAADPQLLAAVKAKNASGEKSDDIQRKDKEWTQNPQYALRKTMSTSACAQRLRELTKDDANIVEVILMDKNGANVCVAPETSDYWQGDEAKFQKTYGEGKDVFVDEPAPDKSTGVFQIQLSVIVKDGAEKAGALTLGLRIKQ